MSYTLDLLKRLADGPARQFGLDYGIAIRDLEEYDLEHSIVHINDGHVTNRQEGDGPSKVALETPHRDPASLEDHLGCLIRTSNGKVLKSSTVYTRNEGGDSIDYPLSINYDITGLMIVNRSIKALIDIEPQGDMRQQPKQIIRDVSDLLDTLTEQSMVLIGKPAAPMNKEEKVTVIQSLNNAGAFPITKSRDKVSKCLGISRFTLYSHIDVSNCESDSKKA